MVICQSRSSGKVRCVGLTPSMSARKIGPIEAFAEGTANVGTICACDTRLRILCSRPRTAGQPLVWAGYQSGNRWGRGRARLWARRLGPVVSREGHAWPRARADRTRRLVTLSLVVILRRQCVVHGFFSTCLYWAGATTAFDDKASTASGGALTASC